MFKTSFSVSLRVPASVGSLSFSFFTSGSSSLAPLRGLVAQRGCASPISGLHQRCLLPGRGSASWVGKCGESDPKEAGSFAGQKRDPHWFACFLERLTLRILMDFVCFVFSWLYVCTGLACFHD